jgi:hypothetical protein
LPLQFQQQVGNTPHLAKGGILHTLHEERVGVGGGDFRGAFKARWTRHALAEEGGTLRLAQVRLARQEILQKLAHRLALRPFLLTELRTF